MTSTTINTSKKFERDRNDGADKDETNDNDNQEEEEIIDETQLRYWTQRYRQSIVDMAVNSPYHSSPATTSLASSTPTEVSWNVSQHMLDKLWNDDNANLPGTRTTSTTSTSTSLQQRRRSQQQQLQHRKRKSTLPSSSSSSSSSSSEPVIVYACQECGYRLYCPGFDGRTQLRVERHRRSSLVKRSTIRRREQRKYAKQMRRKAMEAKKNTANVVMNVISSTSTTTAMPTPTPSTSTSTINHDLLGQSSSSFFDDDSTIADDNTRTVFLDNDPSISKLDKTHLVLKCGQCGAKYHIPGPRRSKGTTTKKNDEKVLNHQQQVKGKMTGKRKYDVSSISTNNNTNGSSQKPRLKHIDKMEPLLATTDAKNEIIKTSTSSLSLQNNFEMLPPSDRHTNLSKDSILGDRTMKRKTPPPPPSQTPRSLSAAAVVASSTTDSGGSFGMTSSNSKSKSSMSLIEQRQIEKFGQKKRKKSSRGGDSGHNKPTKKKNQLLDFLSTLNDP